MIGGTGALGSAIVHELVARGLPVRALVRDEAKAGDRLPEEVDVVVGDGRDIEAMTDACDDAAGTDPGLRMASGPMLRLLGLFNADLRAVREVR